MSYLHVISYDYDAVNDDVDVDENHDVDVGDVDYGDENYTLKAQRILSSLLLAKTSLWIKRWLSTQSFEGCCRIWMLRCLAEFVVNFNCRSRAGISKQS